MNPRTTLILSAIALVLGAFVYFYEIGGEDARREAEEQARRLFPDVAQDEIEWISLTTSDQIEARVERREDSWQLNRPVEFPADRFAVDGMAANLATLVSEAELENPQPPAEYGLQDGARVVRFSVGGETRELWLGSQTPVGSNSYAKTGDSSAIYTVQTYKAQSFDKALDDLREKRILDFDTASIRRVEARWPGGRVVLERAGESGDGEAREGDPGAWRLLAPLEGRADEETVDELLSDLSFLRAKGFVDDPLDDALAGFDPPAFEVILTPEAQADAPAAALRLAIGGLSGGDRLVQADPLSLYTIAPERFADFPRELVAYRFKQLARFPITDAQQVDLFFQPEVGDPVAVSAIRGDAGWTSSPEAVAPDKLARLVSELSRLRAEAIVADEVGAEERRELGLSPPNVILSVFGAVPEEGEETGEPGVAQKLSEIHIGGFHGADGIVASVAGDPIVYRVDYELAEHIPVSLEAFRNRFVSEPSELSSDEAGVLPDAGSEDFPSATEESP